MHPEPADLPSAALDPSHPRGSWSVIELHAAGATVPELEDVISTAIPDRFDSIQVLGYRQVSGGVDVEARATNE